MKTSKRHSPEVKERAVRLLLENESNYESSWAALVTVSSKIGCTPETLRSWVKHEEVDAGRRDGLTTSDRERLKALEKENKELLRVNEILKTASAFFGLRTRSAAAPYRRPGAQVAGASRAPRP